MIHIKWTKNPLTKGIIMMTAIYGVGSIVLAVSGLLVCVSADKKFNEGNLKAGRRRLGEGVMLFLTALAALAGASVLK